MTDADDSTLALERVRAHLDAALDDSADPEVRYHLRQALQLADAVEGLDADGRSTAAHFTPESVSGEH